MEADVDLAALGAALDEQRSARGLSWAGVARELAGSGVGSSGRRAPVAASTIAAIGTRSVAEGDGVLQLLLWLGRTPESFVPGHPLAWSPDTRLPAVGPGRILRWDTAAVFGALDERRTSRGLTWAAVAGEVGGGWRAGNLTGLASASRVAFPSIMRVTGWLGRPAAAFTRAADA